MRTTWAGIAGASAVFVLAASAWAQDYTVTQATGLYEARPASATRLYVMQASIPTALNVTLPFAFPYYGTVQTNVTATTAGFLLFPQRTSLAIQQMLAVSAQHGQDVASGAFPYTQTGVGGAGLQNFDGIVAPWWSNASGSYLYTWTVGAAPTRHVVFAWESFATTNGTVAFQVHLYEGSGRIEFAYGSFGLSGPTGGATYVCGIDSPVDARFTAPLGAGRIALGSPGGDFVFDPKPTTYTGKLLYDQTVADETGIGNSTLFNRPMYGATVALVRGDGGAAAYAATATDGSFSITGSALPPSASGSIVALAQNAACFVWPAPGLSTISWTPVSSISFASGADVGTHALDLGADSVGDLRAAFHVARVCLTAHDWAAQRTSDSIAPIYVFVDGGDASPTTFLDGGGDALLRIAGRSAANPDVWDDSVVARYYARHVLASICAAQSSPYDFRFDAATDPQNAFAEGFAYYFWAALSGRSTAVDAVSAKQAVVVGLETPPVTVTKGPDVAGCVAGALYDLLDPANETFDTYDGTSATDRVFRATDSLTSAPTSDSFLQAWVDAGYDAQAITRIFIGSGLLADDAFEPNDSAVEAKPLGNVGFLTTGLVLNRFDEDWFSTTLASSTESLRADVVYPQAGNAVLVSLEIRDAAGASVLATNGPPTTFGVIHAATGPVPAGTYLIRARLVPGATALKYDLQVYTPPTIGVAPLPDWTVGRNYDVPLGISGGVPPYTLSTSTGALPPGIGFDPANGRVIGRPSRPGTYDVTIVVGDAREPADSFAVRQTVVFHDAFKVAVAPFLAFPAGRAVDVELPTSGGTPPFATATSAGALPEGLAFDAGTLHVVGTALPQSSVPLTIEGTDAAGSSDRVATWAVVAVEAQRRSVPATLSAGTDACGWWFDAVAGSRVSFVAVTAPRRPKRALAGVLLAPDRSVLAGGRIVALRGKLAASGFVCPTSGRYCFVASAADSGPATRLLGTAVVVPPKSGAGSFARFDPGTTTSVQFGAAPGTTLVLKFGGDRSRLFGARVVELVDPDGRPIPVAAYVKSGTYGGVLKMRIGVGGTWTIVFGAESKTGKPGALTYSYVLKPKRGAVYSAD